ncbi:hypothetical protein L6R52_23875 [Myxococcota bacterium]|nr:hypothetical protein [Myxococcota bacterium]
MDLMFAALGVGLAACSGSPSRDRGTEVRGDAGSMGNGDAAVDAGSGSGLDDRRLREHGTGRYAILLSDPSPDPYCWFIEETTRVCEGDSSVRNAYADLCFDAETNCLALEPAGSETMTDSCWIRVSYENPGNGPLYGSCDRVAEYFDQTGDTQCLYHDHCPENRLCADYRCLCPSGVTCGCFECGPGAPPTCDGDVLVEQIQGAGCDANDRCYYEERRTDCAATGGTCDPSGGTCTTGQGGARDGGTPSVHDGGTPATPDAGRPDAATPDAGRADAATPDAGCLCPPLAPPTCVGDVATSRSCDPVTCAVSTRTDDCAARGEVCDPSTVTCVPDVECRVAADCPPSGPTPPGTCATITCEQNTCVETLGPC